MPNPKHIDRERNYGIDTTALHGGSHSDGGIISLLICEPYIRTRLKIQLDLKKRFNFVIIYTDQ